MLEHWSDIGNNIWCRKPGNNDEKLVLFGGSLETNFSVHPLCLTGVLAFGDRTQETCTGVLADFSK